MNPFVYALRTVNTLFHAKITVGSVGNPLNPIRCTSHDDQCALFNRLRDLNYDRRAKWQSIYNGEWPSPFPGHETLHCVQLWDTGRHRFIRVYCDLQCEKSAVYSCIQGFVVGSTEPDDYARCNTRVVRSKTNSWRHPINSILTAIAISKRRRNDAREQAVIESVIQAVKSKSGKMSVISGWEVLTGPEVVESLNRLMQDADRDNLFNLPDVFGVVLLRSIASNTRSVFDIQIVSVCPVCGGEVPIVGRVIGGAYGGVGSDSECQHCRKVTVAASLHTWASKPMTLTIQVRTVAMAPGTSYNRRPGIRVTMIT